MKISSCATLGSAGYRYDVSLEFEYHMMDLTIIDREYAAGIEHLEHCGWKVSR